MSIPDEHEKKRMPRNIRKKYVNEKKCARRRRRREIKRTIRYEYYFLTEIEYNFYEHEYQNNYKSILVK